VISALFAGQKSTWLEATAPPPARLTRLTWQFMAHPTWVERHAVYRGCVPSLLVIGISTVSTLPDAAPSDPWSANTSLWVPSGAVWVLWSVSPPASEAEASTLR
jgi:hypothetical protein